MKSDFLLDPQIAYLNHGSFGACPKPVFEAYQRYQLELETEPVTFLQRRFPDLMNTARTSLSDFLGSHPDQVAFVRNATFGMNQAARSLDLKPGDKVLTSSQEYGAIDRMWQAVCADRGAELVRVPIALPCQSAETITAAFVNHLNPAVRVISFSHITSESALVFPAAEIVELAKAAGAITVIDGAHAPGQIPLNLDNMGADMYIGNCHKWMMAPKGAAFFHASAEWAERARPLVVGWGDHSLGKTPLVVECDW